MAFSRLTNPLHLSPFIIPFAMTPNMIALQLLQMLELAVSEIKHQDERVWTMKQDEPNRPLDDPRTPSSLTPFQYGSGKRMS